MGIKFPASVPQRACGRQAWSVADAAAVHCGLVGRVMGGRHESPRRGSDMFMALVVLGLLVVLAAVVIPALAGR